MALDSEVQRWLQQLATAQLPPVETLPVDEARRQMREATEPLETGEMVHRMEDRVVSGPLGPIPVRVYDPGVPGQHPVLVYFHGGGWVLGSIETHDCLCRCLANAAGVKVISVEYRLAPEHRYPAAAEDAYAAVCAVAADGPSFGIDPARIVVGGDSAGGNLAAVVALMARDRRGPSLRGQVLIYPVLDYDFDTNSYLQYIDGYFLTRDAMMWFWDQYVPEAERRNEPYAAPLRAKDVSQLPPALIVAAECDPLRDEAAAYARRLRAAGNQVTYLCYPGMIHGFVRRLKFWKAGREALAEIAQTIRKYVELES